MYCPSGVHAGEMKVVRSSRVMARAFRPSASTVQTFSAPERSLTKAMDCPSGDQRGCASNAVPLVIRVAVPPAMGRV